VYSRKHGKEIVQQINVNDGEMYCHPNIYKQFALNSFAQRQYREDGQDLGISWEITPDTDDHYTVQMSSFRQSMINPDHNIDYDADFHEALDDEVKEPVWVESKRNGPICYLPDPSGRFKELNVTHPELVMKLVAMAAGKSRLGKEGEILLQAMFNNAKNLVNPGAVFPGLESINVNPVDIGDHVASAFVTGIEHETQALSAIDSMKVAISKHAKSLTPGKVRIGKGMSLDDLMQVMRDSSVAALRTAVIMKSAKNDSVSNALKAAEAFF